jgi:hypothetical protein
VVKEKRSSSSPPAAHSLWKGKFFLGLAVFFFFSAWEVKDYDAIHALFLSSPFLGCGCATTSPLLLFVNKDCAFFNILYMGNAPPCLCCYFISFIILYLDVVIVLLKKTAVHVIAVMGKKKLVFFELYGKK